MTNHYDYNTWLITINCINQKVYSQKVETNQPDQVAENIITMHNINPQEVLSIIKKQL
jgi:hypothetical protein